MLREVLKLSVYPSTTPWRRTEGQEAYTFTPRRLNSQGKRLRYPLARKLGGPQSRSERCGEDKKSHHCPCRELNPGCPARSLVSILTEIDSKLAPSQKLEKHPRQNWWRCFRALCFNVLVIYFISDLAYEIFCALSLTRRKEQFFCLSFLIVLFYLAMLRGFYLWIYQTIGRTP
jgi:hypothetical protein